MTRHAEGWVDVSVSGIRMSHSGEEWQRSYVMVLVERGGERELLIWINQNHRRCSGKTASRPIASSASDAYVRLASGNHLFMAHQIPPGLTSGLRVCHLVREGTSAPLALLPRRHRRSIRGAGRAGRAGRHRR